MVTWTAVSDDEARRRWDHDLEQLSGDGLLQSFGWGNYKKTQGWTPVRFEARSAQARPVAMAQILVRTYPGRTVVAWCPGGLAGPIDLWSSDLLDRIATVTRARRLYLRVTFSRPCADDDVRYLSSRGWARPRSPVGAPMTMIWDLSETDEQMLAGLRPNWRHNLNRALRRKLRVSRWADASPAALGRLFDAMGAYKKINTGFDVSRLTALLQSLERRVVIYGCEDEHGAPLAIRAAAVQGTSAWDLLAATSPEGRRCYASYAVFWALARECRALGVTSYDLSGVDPGEGRGVYDFKRGTGAREVRWLGEWEWSTSALLRHGVNLATRHRSESGLP